MSLLDENGLARVWSKMKTWVGTKVQTDVPTNAVFTDEKVTQTESTTNKNYEILMSGTASTATLTEGANKSSKFTANPNTGAVTFGSRASGSTTGNYSFAQGTDITASNSYSHAEGYSTKATGPSTHAEGECTEASSQCAHAEGYNTKASNHSAHAEGFQTIATGIYAHAEGFKTVANHLAQHVFGEYNILDSSEAAATARGTYVEIVGNGTATSARANARTLDWSGNEVLSGKLTVGAAPTNNMDVATKKYVDDAASELSSSLTYKSIAIPSSNINSKITVNRVYGGVRGGVAEFYLQGVANASIATWESLVTALPNELKPRETNNAYFININNILYVCNLNQDGLLNTPQAISNGQIIRFKVTYIPAVAY